jgi:hypothetical protein
VLKARLGDLEGASNAFANCSRPGLQQRDLDSLAREGFWLARAGERTKAVKLIPEGPPEEYARVASDIGLGCWLHGDYDAAMELWRKAISVGGTAGADEEGRWDPTLDALALAMGMEEWQFERDDDRRYWISERDLATLLRNFIRADTQAVLSAWWHATRACQ